jgi:hypothetical protein
VRSQELNQLAESKESYRASSEALKQQKITFWMEHDVSKNARTLSTAILAASSAGKR